jgi:Ca-activated chloride channel family protein
MILPTILSSLLLLVPSTDELRIRAQEHLSQEQWQLAADALDELADISTPQSEVYYDKGVAHYELDSFEIAADSFEQAMILSQDDVLRAYSAFNYGNAIFQKTINDLEGANTTTTSEDAVLALEQAKKHIRKTLRSYRSAIAHDSTDMDARANGEFAWKILQNLEQMQKQIEEQQKEKEQQQEKQDEQSADEQEKDQEKKDEGESEEQQQQDGEQSEEEQQQQDGQQSEEQQQQDGEQSEEQQQQDGEQSEEQQQQDGEQSEEQQQQDGQQSEEQQQQDGQQSEEQQQQDGQQSEEQNNDLSGDENDNQDISEGELQTSDSEEEDSENKINPQPNEKEEGKRLSKDEANRLLQLVRDKEKQRRKVLAARKAAKRVPVEKDW